MRQLETILVGTHAMVAAQTGQEHWLLTDEEAKGLVTAGLDVLSFYPVHASEKSIAIGMLLYAIGTTYGSRILGTVMLRQAERPTAHPPGAAPASSVGIAPMAPVATAAPPPSVPGGKMTKDGPPLVEIAPGVFQPRIDA